MRGGEDEKGKKEETKGVREKEGETRVQREEEDRGREYV